MPKQILLATAAVLTLVLAQPGSVLHAQGFGGIAGTTPPALRPPVAMTGEPFGVVMAELPLPPGFAGGVPRVLVEDGQGRVFYPVVSVQTVEVLEQPPQPPRIIGRQGGLIDRVRSAIRGEPTARQVPVGVKVSALFTGTEPLELKLVGDINQALRVQPQPLVPGEHRELLAVWWEQYVAWAQAAIAGEDTPKLLHKYLTTMLADRLDLPRVDLDSPDPEAKPLSQPLETLALLAAIEPQREQILEDVISHPGDVAEANLPLPPEPQWLPRALPPVDEQVAIESLATRVPPECFYLRFGSFTNYVWFQEISERYGGDIAQAVVLRGFNSESSLRMERMLATKLTAVSKMFGDKLIGDMAIIGSDLYMKEGATLGVLFYATNPGLLKSSMESDRRGVLAKNADASEQLVTIGDRQVSLLSTPDNRIRSFLLVDGEFLLITTSETLVRRFLEVGAGDRSLADTPEFRWARTWMPEANDYSVFGYFSNEFFHRLVSPQYQIELRRRLEAIAHLEVAEIASQAAEAEGVAADDVDALQVAGLLPPWFDVRPDGARVLRIAEHWIDSSRGGRGSFMPIADMPVEQVTQREAEAYAKTADFYLQQWQHMDPMLVGLRRFRIDGSKSEQVAFEGYVAPFEPEKYGWIARQLASPTPVEMLLPADDAVSVQLHMRGQSGLFAAPDDYHLFGGIKDMIPPAAEDTQGLIKTLQALRAAPAYIGAWPKPGLIEQLPLGIGLARPDYAGFSRMIGGLWRWQNNELSLLSFDRSILDQAIPQIAPRESTDLAQARLSVANLSGSKLATWVNQQWYQRGWRASQGNARFLDDVHQQLKVPGEQSLAAAERLLDVRLQCPLGGKYQFSPYASGTSGRWQSTAWEGGSFDAAGKPMPPANYSAPWIEWFQGGKVHITQRPDSLAVVGSFQLEMQPLRATNEPSEAGLLPPMNFDLFNLPFKLFGGEAAGKAKAPKAERKSF